MNARFKRVTDLYTRGEAVKLRDGSHLWVQVINGYEREECMADAAVARARLILAMRDKGDERIRIEANLERVGRDKMTQELAQRRAGDKVPDLLDEMRDEDEWKERLEILRRTDFDGSATPPSEEEIASLARINNDITVELSKREELERAYQTRTLERLDEEAFLNEYLEAWLEYRARDIMTAEYRLTEIWYATRFCNAVADEDGTLTHERCNGHRDRVFETKADARSSPDELQVLLRETLDNLDMGGRDPKGSDSPENSSGSSSTPSEAAASPLSTSTATPNNPPGTSPSPSPTP